MRNRNFRIAVFGAAFAMSLMMMPTKVSVHAAEAGGYTPGEELVESIQINKYYEQTLNDIASEVFDTYTSSADKRNAEVTADTTEDAQEDKYKNIGIANVEDYLNVRAEANEGAEIVGTLEKNGGCHVYSIDENGWAKIKSGDVCGYVLSKYLVTGEEVPALVEEVGTKIGIVNTETVRLREEKSTESITFDLLSEGEEVKVLNDSDEEWVQVKADGQKGYIAKDYLDVDYKLATAKPVVKEEPKEEVASLTEASSTTSAASAAAKSSSTSSKSSSASSKSSSSKSSTASSNTSSSTSSIRSNIVSYAKQFLGGKYVYGGTSLTSGVDCSGFTMKIYEHFGYNITRTSRSQASAGKTISVSNVKPGDLLFYTSGGTINHVAMYIGNGQVIHASNPKSGIKISNMNYRTPYKAVRFIND